MQNLDSRPLPSAIEEARTKNWRNARRHLIAASRDWLKLHAFRKGLRERAKATSATVGIFALHFIIRAKDDQPFPFFAAMAVLSAQARHPKATTFVLGMHEPNGRYWDAVKNRIDFILVPDFNWYGPAHIPGQSEKMDIARLLALREIGGVALDCDTLTLQNMDDLLDFPFVLGSQAAIPGTKSNFGRSILAAQREAPFARAWLKSYEGFNPLGGPLNWDTFSTELPMLLYAQRPAEAKILPHYRWFFPLWHRARAFLFDPSQADAYFALTRDQYVVPLWQDVIGQELATWEPEMLLTNPCLYSRLCLEALAALPPQDLQSIAIQLGLPVEALMHHPHHASLVQ